MSWQLRFNQEKQYWIGYFDAMACPCTVFVDTDNHDIAHRATQLAFNEAKRIEYKYSRYRDDSIIGRINTARGQPTAIDTETELLLNYATSCFELSEGRFDISSGVLGKLWRFKDQHQPPASHDIATTLKHIGWHKAKIQPDQIQLPDGMAIDLGGIGKEYAVDRSILLIRQAGIRNVLVNFGGDICCTEGRRNDIPWEVILENPAAPDKPAALNLHSGAITTSGDSRRSFEYQGKRYSHILNALTGWPVEDAPRSVTVAGNTCLEAGMLSSFAMLEGKHARGFLQAQGVDYICID